MEYHITPYQPQYHERIIRIWERSVRATHHFLTEADLTYYTLLVQQMDFSCYSMLCAFTADGTLAGFAGTSGQQLDMLFLDPEYLGRGLGKALLTRCVEQLGVRRVEVNEQN
ncbi:MAG: GNAT family N-acetyltransferase, partial [Chitinophagaceae bacterium]|nr:GNAT family N-acetyltransferase [Chitinophagaceae bacterium]